MNKKILAIASALLIATLVISTAGASSIKFSASFSLGSLKADGFVSGLGNTDVTLVLDASGIPAITCINNGSNPVPGQSFPKVSAEGTDVLPGNSPLRKNGKAPYTAEASAPATIPWDQAGCPNANWTAMITFVFWTDAKITVFDTATGLPLASQRYTCTTTLTSVSCTPIN
jgi:hypothetical protein